MKNKKLQWHPAFYAGLQIELKDEANSGIYYVHRTNNILPIQIIVTSRLNTDENLWLRSLTNHLTNEDDAKKLITEYETNQHNKLYESVMDIIIRANKLI